MDDPGAESKAWSRNNAKNTVRLRYWALAWVTSLAPAAFGPIIGLNINALPTVLAGMIADYWKYQ